jgi:hypothetical protein
VCQNSGATVRPAACTISTSIMPAAIRPRTPRLNFPAVAPHPWARPEGSAIRGRCPLCPSTPAPLCTRLGRRLRESNRIPSGLTLRQPYRANVTVLDGPCDPRNPPAAPTAGRRLPGSHGSSKERVNNLELTLPYCSMEQPLRLIFFGPMPGRHLLALRCAPATGRGCAGRLSDRTGRRRSLGGTGGESREEPALRFVAGRSVESGAARHERTLSLMSLSKGAGK